MSLAAEPEARQVLVVVNDDESQLRRFEPWLADLGAHITFVTGDEVPETVDGYDGIVLLGGGFMPDDYERAPWLVQERSLAEDAIRSGTPLLGICLGAQLLAQVAGGVVKASEGAPEWGSTPINLLPAAADDPIFAGLPSTIPMIEHHRDRITELPGDAVHLAASDACPIQAFRVGAAAWGVQFHPEQYAARLRTWNADALARNGVDLAELVETATANEPEAESAAWQLLTAWVAVLSETQVRVRR